MDLQRRWNTLPRRGDEARYKSMIHPRKKLLIIGPVPPPFSGPEIGTKTLLESQVLNEACEVHHLNTTVRKSNAEKGKLDVQMVTAFLRYLFSLFGILWRERPEYALYCPTTASLKGWTRDGTTILLCKLFSTRLFMQFRGGHFRFFYDSLNPIFRWCIRTLLRQSAAMLAQSERLKRQFEGILAGSQIGRFPNSISNSFFSSFDTVERGDTDRPVTVLFIGHLSFAKGYCDLLETIPTLCADHDVRFRFVGAPASGMRNIHFNQATGERLVHNNPTEWYQRFIVDAGVEAHVERMGERIEGEAKLDAFKEADIFVLPSYSEGFSMAILEAMAAGLPVIATCVGAAPDVIEDGKSGYVINPGDIPVLMERLESLIANRQKRLDVGQAAREECRANFLVDAVSRRLLEILDRGPGAVDP